MKNSNEVGQALAKGVSPQEDECDFFMGKRVSNIIFPPLGDLSSFFFKGTIFTNVSFCDFSFYGADLGESTFINCCFDKCSMAKAGFYKTRLVNCTFKESSFQGARIIEGKIENCAFTETDFTKAIITRSIICNSVLSNDYNGLLDHTEPIRSIWEIRESKV